MGRDACRGEDKVAHELSKMLVQDLSGPNSYGTPLAGWKGQAEFFRNPGPAPQPGALPPNLASTFIEKIYVLVTLQRALRVYRGFETAGLQAPFGLDHPSFVKSLVAQCKPGTPDGLWWTPARSSMAIENLRLPDMHRSEHRDSAAIQLEWNRIDYYLESELPAGALV